MSFGERLSAVVVAAAFRAAGIDAVAVDARGLIVAEGDFGNARPVSEATVAATQSRLFPRERDGAGSPARAPCPSSRASSPRRPRARRSPSAAAAPTTPPRSSAPSSGADEVEIWTDVDGILTADPRKVPDAFSLESPELRGGDGALPLRRQGHLPADHPARPRARHPHPHPQHLQSRLRRHDHRVRRRALALPRPGHLLDLRGRPRARAGPRHGRRHRHRDAALRLPRPQARQHHPHLAGLERAVHLLRRLARRQGGRRSPRSPRSSPAELADGRIGEPVIEARQGDHRHRGRADEAHARHLGQGLPLARAATASTSRPSPRARARSTSRRSSTPTDEAKALNAVHEAFFLSGTRSVNVFLAGCGRRRRDPPQADRRSADRPLRGLLGAGRGHRHRPLAQDARPREGHPPRATGRPSSRPRA